MRNFNFKHAAMAASLAMLVACEQQGDISPDLNQDTQEISGFQYKRIPNRYIVTFKQDGSSSRLISMDYQTAQQTVREISRNFLADQNISADAMQRVFSSGVQGFVADLDDATLERVKADPRTGTVEPDYMIIMARPPRDGGSTSPSQTVPYGIARVNGGVTYTGSNVAWVVDTGIDLDHPDLNVDASRGFNAFTSGKDGQSLDDGNGHGTHVAGTIGAIDNNIGVIGVAAGATVVPIKVLGSRGSGSYSGVIAGVDFIAANGRSGDVANMSLGGPASSALDAAVLNAASKGIRFCLAAGNEAQDAANVSPGRVNGPNVYTISAMDSGDRFASFSNFGNPPIDYCAPGVGINSTWFGGGYRAISGTSMASPHAAGVLLLGAARTGGFVINDPDGNPDPIIVR